jgi:dynein regulatory complex protein 1
MKLQIMEREHLRQQQEIKKAEDWLKKHHTEQTKSKEIYNRLMARFTSILEIKNPFELEQELKKQKETSAEILDLKNALIREYLTDLKAKDEDYVKEFKTQTEETDELLKRMDQQFAEFQTTLNQELDKIEKAFVKERADSLAANKKDLDRLMEARRENERKYTLEREIRSQTNQDQLSGIYTVDYEAYNSLKIKLENDIHLLEQQLAQMKATYQLNMEKLEYNYQVLKKREDENAGILAGQKRRITKLTDHLNNLKLKVAKQEKGFQQECVSLDDDYKRMTEQLKQLQKKFQHFQILDQKRYEDMKSMNCEEILEYKRKIIMADQIIHEQQLYMSYGPQEKSGAPHANELDKSQERPSSSPGNKDLLAIKALENRALSVSHVDLVQGRKGKRDDVSTKREIRQVLQFLCDESGFLVIQLMCSSNRLKINSKIYWPLSPKMSKT